MSRTVDPQLRDRAILPVLIPLAAIVVTEIVVFAMSRILLSSATGPDGGPAPLNAVWVATAAMVAIMVGASIIALRPRIKTNTILAVCALGLVVTVAAGVHAMQRGSVFTEPHAVDLPEIEVSAAALAFDTDEITLDPHGTAITFVNADTEQHNIAVFADDTLATVLFRGDIIPGDQEIHYEVGELEEGTYYFHCDVHPTMNGEAVVEAAA